MNDMELRTILYITFKTTFLFLFLKIMKYATLVHVSAIRLMFLVDKLLLSVQIKLVFSW